MLDLALLQAELANGIYDKLIEVFAKEIHVRAIARRKYASQVIATWKREGLLPEGVADQIASADLPPESAATISQPEQRRQ
jgi:hypothetical protein